MIDRQGNPDDSREDDALLYAEEQNRIEADIQEAYAEAQKLQDAARGMNEIDDWADHGWKKSELTGEIAWFNRRTLPCDANIERELRNAGITPKLEKAFNITINDDPRRHFPWPTTEDYNATPLKFARLARHTR